MPAEYSNALSGVFDIFMRNGNNQKHEHTFQLFGWVFNGLFLSCLCCGWKMIAMLLQ
jgi:hypothetical protein